MRVAVTGASGFIGQAVLRHLVANGHDVLALSRRRVPETAGIRWRSWDLASGPLHLTSAIDPVDAVVHAAAHVDDWDPWPVHERVTVGGTRAVLDTFGPARLVLISSCSVYPLRAPGQRFPEHIPTTAHPLSPYVRAKIAQENLVATHRDSLILRPHAVYGTADPTLLPRLARARRRGRLVVPGGRRTLVHLTHVEVLARAVAAGVESALTGIVNVADERPLELAKIAEGLAAANHWTERPLHLGAGVTWTASAVLEGTACLTARSRPPLLTRYSASHLASSRTFDTTRMRRELGVEPTPTDLSVWHA